MVNLTNLLWRYFNLFYLPNHLLFQGSPIMINDIGVYLKGVNPLFYAAAAGMVVGFWGKLKGYTDRIFKLIFFTVKFEGSDNLGFIAYLLRTFPLKRTIFSDVSLMTHYLYYLPKKTPKSIFLYDFNGSGGSSNSVTYVYKWIFPVVFSSTYSRETNRTHFSIMTLRFVPLWAWLKSYQDYLINKSERNFFFRDISGRRGNRTTGPELAQAIKVGIYTPEESLPVFISKENLETPRLSHHITYYIPDYMQEVYDDIKFFIDSKDWYFERLLTYKRGYLFYGLPGTGKTSFIRVMGEELNIPIYRFDLSSFGNNDFKASWEETCASEGLKIILFEDFHSVFNGRENITNLDGIEPGLSFDCLLNTIDGVQKNSSVILVATTNDISVMDSAMFGLSNNGLVSRPGRIDMAVEFQKLDLMGRLHIANVILKGLDSCIQEVCAKYDDCTAAQFEEVCKQRAKQEYYKLKA